MIRPSAANPINDLFPPEGSFVKRESEPDILAALNKINRAHESDREGERLAMDHVRVTRIFENDLPSKPLAETHLDDSLFAIAVSPNDETVATGEPMRSSRWST